MLRTGCCLAVWVALAVYGADVPTVGVLPGDPVGRLGVERRKLTDDKNSPVRFLRTSRYLNNRVAVVTHTLDDTSRFVTPTLDAIDKYGLKATLFISTQREGIAQLWARLEKAVQDGHEIGSHSRTHACRWPDTQQFCGAAYSESEIAGSRDDILKNLSQPYVWAWCYPCGLCAGYPEVQQKLAKAGYLVARNYPDEAHDRHVLPDMQTWDSNPYNANYTQVAQKIGGIAKSGRTDVAQLDAKFDEVLVKGGIYNLMSHPQWVDLGPDRFYERHLSHLGGRANVWYVPMGPLYAFHTVAERTRVQRIGGTDRPICFAVYNDLDPKVYRNSVTLEFMAPAEARVLVDGKKLQSPPAMTDRWDGEYVYHQKDITYVTIRPNRIIEFDTDR